MNTARDSIGVLSRVRPLAAALALACVPVAAPAVTHHRPGELPPDGTLTREDGTPLRVALRAWHLDALANAVPPLPTATVRPVTNCDDDGPGSLRAVLAAVASGDTIELGALTCSRISLVTGALAAHVDTLTIEGPASGDFAIDGNDLDRVLLHYGSGGLTLSHLTLTHGRRVATGPDVGIAGCLASAGYVTLYRSTVTGCYAAGEGAYGGGIYAYSLILWDSTLSASTAFGTHPTNGTAAFGGGAFVYQVDLVESTVSGNTARHRVNPGRSSYDIGGGISTVRGGLVVDSTIDSNYSYGRGGGLATFTDLLVSNSTISGNVARTFGGGGLFVRFPARLDARNSTIAANSARTGGGVLTNSSAATLVSTIVAGNEADTRNIADFAALRALTVSGSNDLVDETSSTIVLPGDALRGDPGLLPLAYNGGPTRTHALRGSSAAIDAGSNAGQLTGDQRGYPRVVGASTDIGAFESNAEATPAGNAPRSVPALLPWASLLLAASLFAFGLLNRRRMLRVRDARN